MSFYMLMGGELKEYQFDYLTPHSEKTRLQNTLPHGKVAITRPGKIERRPYVIEVMSKKLKTINQESTIGEAIELLKKHGIHHLPVLNSEKKLSGLFSDRDLVKLVEGLQSNGQVQSLMSHIVIAASEETPLDQAALVMVNEKVSALPVLSTQLELKGMLSKIDVLKWFIQHPFFLPEKFIDS